MRYDLAPFHDVIRSTFGRLQGKNIAKPFLLVHILFFIRFVLRSYKKLYEKASAKPRKRSPRVKVPASDGERGELRVGQTDEAHAPHQNYGIMMIPSDFGNI